VINEEECVCSVCLFRCIIFIGFRIIKEIPGLVGSGTPYIISPVRLSSSLFSYYSEQNLIQHACCMHHLSPS